jgi:hypothetical protein
VLVRNGQIVLATGAAETVLLATSSVTVADGNAPLPIDFVLAAIAGAWGVGIAPEHITETLGT